MERSPLELLGDEWRAAAIKLGIVAVVPFDLKLPTGHIVRFACHLPQFGGPRGMLLTPTYEQGAFQAAVNAGYAVSVLDPDPLSADFSDLGDFVECLKDWRWSDTSAEAPAWYGSDRQHAV